MTNHNPFATRMFLQDWLVPCYQQFRRGSLPFFPPYGHMLYAVQPEQNQKEGTDSKVDNKQAGKDSSKTDSLVETNSAASSQKSEGEDNAAATNKIVSKAMAALSRTPNQPFSMQSRRHSMQQISNSLYHLNALTQQFLKRSMARSLGSRPAGIVGSMPMNNNHLGAFGNEVMAAVGKEVDAQAKILLAHRRRASMEMSKKVVDGVGKSDSAGMGVSLKMDDD